MTNSTQLSPRPSLGAQALEEQPIGALSAIPERDRPANQLVTAALPYANGSIHLGHLVESALTDIHVRRLKQKALSTGAEIRFVCADDQHGSAITLRAKKEGVEPEALIARLREEHLRDFEGFRIGFDHYHATHSDENRRLCEWVYGRLKDSGLIRKSAVRQLFDAQEGVFLADRLVKGGCPACRAPGQNGDNCERCGATYRALELIDPVSQISGGTPEVRDSEHVFFRLSDERVQGFCREWASEPGRLAPDALNKISEWLHEPLRDWDISRDGPYFGFEIPGEPGKYFYVWLDAPLGYLAAAFAFFEKEGRSGEWANLTRADIAGQGASLATFGAKPREGRIAAPWEITHVIGKDILYFHALFWPALLHFSGLKTPKAIKTHGFLTIDGAKLSKSRANAVSARQYLDAGFDPEWLRFYFFSKLNGTSQDIDFTVDDFCSKINGSLVGKYVNLASRLAPFAAGPLRSAVNIDSSRHPLSVLARGRSAEIGQAFEALDFAKACRLLFALADEANQRVNEAQPWILAKDPSRAAELAEIIWAALGVFECLTRYLAPVLPDIARRAFAFLGTVDDGRPECQPIESGRALGAFAPLCARADAAALKAVFGGPARPAS